jgi:integrative and conjugative element protein (TIGR02256 family)
MWLKELVKYSPKLRGQARERTPKLMISAEVASFIERTAAQSPNTETGGILIGHHIGRDIRVKRATDAGPSARRSQCGFLRDTEYCQKILNEEFAASGADYLGEWHTHVIDLPRPSRGDLETLARIALDPDYNFPSFAMILAVVLKGEAKLLSYVIATDLASAKRNRRFVTVAQVIPVLEECGVPESNIKHSD